VPEGFHKVMGPGVPARIAASIPVWQDAGTVAGAFRQICSFRGRLNGGWSAQGLILGLRPMDVVDEFTKKFAKAAANAGIDLNNKCLLIKDLVVDTAYSVEVY
jgi:hypothetical protein